MILACAAGCNLVAGLNDHVLTGGSGNGGQGGSGAGGAGGVGGVGGGVGGGGGAGAATIGRWPDSASVYCTNGSTEVTPCPQVGQDYFGQDGNFILNPPTYLEQDDEVRDSVTGLIWDDSSTQQPFDHPAATSHCAAAQPTGEWRLPTRMELVSLMNFGGAPHTGWIGDRHWTSTESATPAEPWSSDLVAFDMRPTTADTENFVLCVRGSGFGGNLVRQGDIARDMRTGLTWQASPDDVTRDWLGALNMCLALTTAGGDWRLPSAKELLTIVRDDQTENPELDGTGEYWTSSPTFNPPNTFTVALPGGRVSSDAAQLVHRARCVRGPEE